MWPHCDPHPLLLLCCYATLCYAIIAILLLLCTGHQCRVAPLRFWVRNIICLCLHTHIMSIVRLVVYKGVLTREWIMSWFLLLGFGSMPYNLVHDVV